ncbi:MAG: aminotransferase class IV, partial [Candidatus Omnitrophota bacterium]
KKTALYFSFPYDEGLLVKFLESYASSFDPEKKYRVRLLLKKNGSHGLTAAVLDDKPVSHAKITVSSFKTDKNGIFLRHKTTNRELYDKELARGRSKGFYDVIFMNQDDEITEGCVSNIVIRTGTDTWTPSLSCGLLDGVYRRYLLETGEIPLKEKVLHLDDILSADSIFMINSVQKSVKVDFAA